MQFLLGCHNCLQFSICPGTCYSNRLHLTFPTITVLTLQVRESMWIFCKPLSISVPIIHSEKRNNYTRFQGPPSVKTPISIWPPLTPLAEVSQLSIGSLGISVNSEPLSNRSLIHIFFFSTVYSYSFFFFFTATLINGHMFLCRTKGEKSQQ